MPVPVKASLRQQSADRVRGANHVLVSARMKHRQLGGAPKHFPFSATNGAA
jgi:hypothetical protein